LRVRKLRNQNTDTCLSGKVSVNFDATLLTNNPPFRGLNTFRNVIIR
jgi:hypothetical protein